MRSVEGCCECGVDAYGACVGGFVCKYVLVYVHMALSLTVSVHSKRQ